MYREKLISQIEVFENAQKVCTITDIPEFIELSENILRLAKKIDQPDENTEVTASSNIPGEKVYETLCKENNKYRQKHTASPLETVKQAIKEILDNNED